MLPLVNLSTRGLQSTKGMRRKTVVKNIQDPRRIGCKTMSLSKSLLSGTQFPQLHKKIADSLILKGTFHHWEANKDAPTLPKF